MPLKGHLNPPKLTTIKGTFTTKLLEPARNFSIGKALSEIERKEKKIWELIKEVSTGTKQPKRKNLRKR